jgi:hypothetical protein
MGMLSGRKSGQRMVTGTLCNTAMDGNIVKIILESGFSDRHSTAKSVMPWSKEAPQSVPSIGIYLIIPLRID